MNGYDNWKMAFFPGAMLCAWYVLTGAGDGGIIPAAACGAMFGCLAADGAFFAAGCRGLKASPGSVASILLWNLVGAAAAAVPMLLLAPGILPAVAYGKPYEVFLKAVLCGALEALACRGGSPYGAMMLMAAAVYFKLPAIIITLPSVLRMQAGDGTLAMLLAIIGNIMGAALWASARELPKR